MLQLTKNCLTPLAKKLIYYGHIHSHLMYCLVVWGSLCKKGDIARLTKAQNKCVKLIDPKKDIDNIYKNHKILKIKEMIELEEVKFGYKLQTIVDHDLSGHPLNKKHSYNTRNKKILNCPSAHNHKYRNSFLNKGIVSFSNLSYSLKSANTLSSIVSGFKKTIFD